MRYPVYYQYKLPVGGETLTLPPSKKAKIKVGVKYLAHEYPEANLPYSYDNLNWRDQMLGLNNQEETSMIHVYNKSISIPHKGDIYMAKIIAKKLVGKLTYIYAKCESEGIAFLVKKEGEYHMLESVGTPYYINRAFTAIKSDPTQG